MMDAIAETVQFLSPHLKEKPVIGMITGTGLGGITEKMAVDFRLPFDKVPHFPTSTVEGHSGNLAGGKIGGKSVLAMEGRFHLYEGYTPSEVTFPIRVMAMLGVKYLFISSAAGGLNPQFEAGNLMAVTDHINLKGSNPLTGPNLDAFGPRFPDMTRAYDSSLVNHAIQKAMDLNIYLQKGIYVGVPGPSLETPAETRFLRMIGADAVGMSTVSQTIVGIHCGLLVLAIAVITNVNLPDCPQPTAIDDVIAVSERVGPVLSELWEHIIRDL